MGLDLSIPVQLSSADRLRTAFTNYVRGYSGALDYVWLERERMRAAREIPLPSEVEVADFLPSRRFPSDHLAVSSRGSMSHAGQACRVQAVRHIDTA